MQNFNLQKAGKIVLILLGGWLLIWLIQPYFSGAKLINPIWLDLGVWQIHWYGLLMALAVLWGWWWLAKESRGTELASRSLDLTIWVVVGGLIGARLLFVILKWPEFSGHWTEIINLSQGGLSIHGAILGGASAVLVYCRRLGLPVAKTLDLLIIPLIVGQMIGRWGNFFNQEAFGGPTNSPWKMWVAPIFRPQGYENFSWFHPTFLYEIIGLGLILGLILIIKKRRLLPGSLTLIYLLSYSVLRFGIEFFRIDSDKWASLTVAQWGSLLIIMGGVIIGLILKRRRAI